MVQLNSAKAGGTEKFVRLLIFGGLIYGGIKLFNAVAPDVIQMMKNIYWVLGLGVPLAFVTLYVLSNPMMIWMQYKRLCRWITSGFIKLDPLSIMKGYLEYLQKKKSNLDETKVKLQGRQVKLQRKCQDLEKSIKENTDWGRAALDRKNEAQATQYGTFAQSDRESLDLFKNLLATVEKNLVFLNKLSENWGYAIEGLDREIQRKEEEYQTLKETVKALKEAREFAQAGEATKLYNESLKALEANVSEKIATIDDFEDKMKPVLDNIDLEKSVRAQKGIAALKASEDSKFLLPTDFSIKHPVQDLEYETIPTKKYDM